MNNLFSIFDPSSNLYLELNWTILLISVMIPSAFWGGSSKNYYVMVKTLKFLKKEIYLNSKSTHPSSIPLFLASLFILIVMSNFSSLLPYVFNSTSHLSVTLSMAAPLWLGYMLWNMFFNMGQFLSNFVPKGTPLALIPFMIVIEGVSNIIRPLTLSVRLMANMVAGHLILALASNLPMHLNYFGVTLVLFILVMLTILEVAVSFIQSYVFMTLSSLYSSEINNINN